MFESMMFDGHLLAHVGVHNAKDVDGERPEVEIEVSREGVSFADLEHGYMWMGSSGICGGQFSHGG
jgi:hypothetical protein